MKWSRPQNKIQSKVQDLLYDNRFFYNKVFKQFNLGEFQYHGVRFKWLVPIIKFLSGCKYRYWKDVRNEFLGREL